MSTSDYDRLYSNIYTKGEVDTIVQSNSGGIIADDTSYILMHLGNKVTTQQSANIANGSFVNLPIGAYWTINNVNYRIMARDQFYGYNGITTHHVVVMPDTIYILRRYNDVNDNSGGYVSSALKRYIELTYHPVITSAFGSHILSHTHDLTSGSYTSGTLTPTANTKVWLINSYNLTGSKYSLETDYSWQNADKVQFPAFISNSNSKMAKYVTSNYPWWLGSSSSNTSYKFCYANSEGSVNNYDANYDNNGVRPALLVY